MEIPMTPVTSSQIESIGYDTASKTLAVKFKRGGLYHYADVPEHKHAAMMDPEASVGTYLGKHIKGMHDFTRIEEKKEGEAA